MRAAIATLLLVALSIAPAFAKRHCTLRLHTEASANDSDVFATQLRSNATGKPVVIQKAAAISEADVIGFKPYPANDGTFGVLLQLDDHGRLALDQLSIERRGSSLFAFVNGRLVTELQIDRRVSDGKIYIPSGVTAAEVDAMRRDWRLIGSKKK